MGLSCASILSLLLSTLRMQGPDHTILHARGLGLKQTTLKDTELSPSGTKNKLVSQLLLNSGFPSSVSLSCDTNPLHLFHVSLRGKGKPHTHPSPAADWALIKFFISDPRTHIFCQHPQKNTWLTYKLVRRIK